VKGDWLRSALHLATVPPDVEGLDRVWLDDLPATRQVSGDLANGRAAPTRCRSGPAHGIFQQRAVMPQHWSAEAVLACNRMALPRDGPKRRSMWGCLTGSGSPEYALMDSAWRLRGARRAAVRSLADA
jgi:hypothetical protein